MCVKGVKFSEIKAVNQGVITDYNYWIFTFRKQKTVKHLKIYFFVWNISLIYQNVSNTGEIFKKSSLARGNDRI